MNKLVTDFEKDMSVFFTNELKKIGFLQSELPKDSVDLRYQYFSYNKRLINPKPRKVFISKELNIPIGYETIYKDLVEVIESGLPLKCYLSKGIKKLQKIDFFLNYFGLHHLHLSNQLDNDGFVKRSDYLVIAKFDEKAVYIAQIYPHLNFKWINLDVIRLCFKNWPFLFKQIYNPNFKQLSDQDTIDYIENRIIVPVYMDNNVYIALNGTTTAKYDADIIFICDNFYNEVISFQDSIRENSLEIMSFIDKESLIKIQFKLVVEKELTISAQNKEFDMLIVKKNSCLVFHQGKKIDKIQL